MGLRLRLFVVMIVCITGYSSASWLCPVYRADSSGLVENDSSDNLAALSSWIAVILPVWLENEVMYADWDYLVTETLTFLPPASGCDILICLDLGVAPEAVRELEVFRVNGEEIEQFSMLGGYPIDLHNPNQLHNSPADSLFHIRRYNRDGTVTRHGLSPARIYRALFESDEDFRSAVPETRRFYADMWQIPCNGEEEIVVQVQYLVRGWTYITGIEPLLFSLCQPLLWNGPIGEGRIVFERPRTNAPEMWYVEFDGTELLEEDTFCYEVEVRDFSLIEEETIPCLLVIPPSNKETR